MAIGGLLSPVILNSQSGLSGLAGYTYKMKLVHGVENSSIPETVSASANIFNAFKVKYEQYTNLYLMDAQPLFDILAKAKLNMIGFSPYEYIEAIMREETAQTNVHIQVYDEAYKAIQYCQGTVENSPAWQNPINATGKQAVMVAVADFKSYMSERVTQINAEEVRHYQEQSDMMDKQTQLAVGAVVVGGLALALPEIISAITPAKAITPTTAVKAVTPVVTVVKTVDDILKKESSDTSNLDLAKQVITTLSTLQPKTDPTVAGSDPTMVSNKVIEASVIPTFGLPKEILTGIALLIGVYIIVTVIKSKGA